jgi:hypothetical protein
VADVLLCGSHPGCGHGLPPVRGRADRAAADNGDRRRTAGAAGTTADARTVEEGLAIQERQAVLDSESATAVAMQNTLLTPRFYTTDFDELDAIDVIPVREDWDALIAQMEADPNKGHFKKNEDWDHVDWDGMEPELKKEFIDFLISPAPPSSRAACSTRK